MVIDLDPLSTSFERVIETAQVIHEILEEVGVKNYCKTSGGRGLHVVIPLHGKYDFEQSKQFAETIAHTAHKRLATTTSLERDPRKRQKRVDLDCLQNRRGQTLVAPYAIRPRPHAPASTPLLWSEVAKGLDPVEFNIHTLPQRLKKMGDLFAPLLKESVNLKAALQKIKKQLDRD